MPFIFKKNKTPVAFNNQLCKEQSHNSYSNNDISDCKSSKSFKSNKSNKSGNTTTSNKSQKRSISREKKIDSS